MTDAEIIIRRAFEQAATVCVAQGISHGQIKEYLREIYGFGTVGPHKIYFGEQSTSERLADAMSEPRMPQRPSAGRCGR